MRKHVGILKGLVELLLGGGKNIKNQKINQ
jgi:hypothetical protein